VGLGLVRVAVVGVPLVGPVRQLEYVRLAVVGVGLVRGLGLS